MISRHTVTEGWLIGGGEMAKLIKSKDWSRTPLGPIDTWPQSLRTVVSLVQASNSPISLSWGAGHIQIYNDGYWPICGAKHPTAMGQDYRECWASAFPVIGAGYESAWAGTPAYLENMRMFLDRYGFLEETWFTFSFSPITDESGQVAGVFHPVTELTRQSLSERRTQTLRDLAASKPKTSLEAFEAAAQIFRVSNLDLPFVLFYEIGDDARTAQLAAQAGLPVGSPMNPRTVNLDAATFGPWPIADVVRQGLAQLVNDVDKRLAGMSVGPYPELPNTAVALPITLPGLGRPAAVMVAGLSARLRVDDAYRSFLDLAAASVSAALANARANEDERQKLEALAEIDRAKTAFFSNVSHEFRTPLTLMLGPLEDELSEHDRPMPPHRRERIEVAHRNSLRLLKLVNGLLDFSRLESGRTQALYEPTDLATLTVDLASSFRSAMERVGLRLTTDCPPLPQPLYVDREMWEKVVLNLLSNAFKHTFVGGVTVSLKWFGEAAQLTVEDTGVGIASKEIPKLFDRFYRVKGAASRTHEGTGIGLSLARELVELHGGVMQVESKLDVGSRFMVTLKAGTAHLPADKIGQSADPTARLSPTTASAYVQEALQWLPDAGVAEGSVTLAPEPSATARKKEGPRQRILLADDNADMRQYIARLLEGDYDVHAVADGAQALEAAQAEAPDLMLSDVMMPRLDGFALVRALRADERTRHLPVILLSARAGEESALEGLDAGADDYLVKPFTAKELIARVRSNLSLAELRREWATKLLQTNRELAEVAQAKGRFMAAISHEIRTPLNAVIGMTGLLAGTQLTAEQQGFANTIRVSGDHLLAIINSILDYTKMESGKLKAERMPFSVARVVEEALEMVGAMAREKHLQLGCKLDAEVYQTVLGDPGRIRQVLLNYLSNAVKFSNRGEVLVTARVVSRNEGRHEIEFAVQDHGIGLTPEECDQLYKPFSQIDGSNSRKYGGTGLGLAISKQLAELMGGRAWVQSEHGKGSTFCFTVLLDAPPTLDKRPAAEPLAPVQAPQLASRMPLRVLVAEDNFINVEIIEYMLKKLGYCADIAGNGLEVLAGLRRQPYDLVLMDVHMPEMDGIEATRQIRKEWPADKAPWVIALTAGVLPDEQQACLDAGMNMILIKPLMNEALAQALTTCWQSRRQLVKP